MTKHIFITDSDFANSDSSFQYVLGFQPSLGAMILSDIELIIFLDGRYFSKTSSIDTGHIKQVLNNQNLQVRFVLMTDIVQDMAGEIKSEDTLYFQDNVAVRYFNAIGELFPESIISTEGSYFQSKREIKTSDEKQSIKEAIQIIDKVFTSIQELIHSGEIFGKTEIELRQYVMQKIFEFGGEGESFETIIAFGKNSAVPHHIAGNTVIENGALLIDMGAKSNGYCSDFTRTLWVGEKNEQFERFEKVYKVVKQSHLSAVNEYQENMTGSDLDMISRKVIQNSEYKDLFIHNLGHSLGIDIHEEPRLKASDKTVLREDMVFTIEPGIYIENDFGIRLEDIVFLENGKLNKYTSINI